MVGPRTPMLSPSQHVDVCSYTRALLTPSRKGFYSDFTMPAEWIISLAISDQTPVLASHSFPEVGGAGLTVLTL